MKYARISCSPLKPEFMNSQNSFMSKLHSAINRLPASIGLLTLIGLSSTLLPVHRAAAQTCGNALSASPVIFPISGSKVVVGQSVTITRDFFGSSDPGNCLFRNGEGFLL